MTARGRGFVINSQAPLTLRELEFATSVNENTLAHLKNKKNKIKKNGENGK